MIHVVVLDHQLEDKSRENELAESNTILVLFRRPDEIAKYQIKILTDLSHTVYRKDANKLKLVKGD